MEIIVAAIVFIVLLVVSYGLTRNESQPSASAPQPDDRQPTTSHGTLPARVAFERLFSNCSETDRSDALRMCQKRLDISHEEAMDRLIRKPGLLAEMLEYARMEDEIKRLD